MPNWCYTTYKCVGDTDDIQQLYDKLKEMQDERQPLIPNGFGNMWLGNLVTKLGGDWEKYTCRGEVIDYSLEDDNTLTISQDTAWSKQGGVRRIIEEKLPSIKVYYQAEEAGCGVFITNSFEHFPDRFLVDSYEGQEYFERIESVAEHISEIVGHEVKADEVAINDALDEYMKEHEDEDVWYGFYSFTEVDDKSA